MSVPPPTTNPSAGEETAPIMVAHSAWPRRASLSITDFITDGSLAGMCDELSRLTGVRVRLLDPQHRQIIGADNPAHWTFSAAMPEPPGPEDVVVPLRIDAQVIGAVVLGPGNPGLAPSDARKLLEEASRLLAATASEFCRHELDLRHRVREVQALTRLSSHLTRASKLEAVLDIALELALDVLELDAGSIVLFEDQEGVSTENEEDLVLKASRHLSRDWLECPLPLSRGRLFDRLALRGEVVVSTDLWTDERVMIGERAQQEGLRSTMQTGLVFQDRPLGVIRLYSRAPRTFDDADLRLLKSFAHQAAVAVEQARLLKLHERDAQLQRQVQLAADVQRRMLPRKVPQIPSLEIATRYVPSYELGGDFYDLFELGPNLGVAIGDVVGKGIAAALLMSSVRASLRAHVQDLYHIDEVMARVNAAMCRDTLDHEFATLWYGVVDTTRRQLTYCSGGHEPPLIIRAATNRVGASEIGELSAGGMAVGIDPLQRYQRGTCELRPGDVLIAYTDGITDTLDFSGKRFGRARLRAAVLQALAEERELSAARLVERIFWELRQFAGLLERPDDQTLVVLRVTPA
jgi:phosphoserine phosphatase RsbU/P